MEMKGGGGGGEVRRLHIIYFLSRMGRVEHPHLLRVHHLTANGVYLRDVKRWLSKLRGKDVTESFAWSYKRRYKAGYVWQDLLDEDLITPISDNEFVLKGSQIPSSDATEKQLYATDGNKKQDQVSSCRGHGQRCCLNKSQDPSVSKASSEIIQESIQFGSESSTSMEYSAKWDGRSHVKGARDRTEKTSAVDSGEGDSCYSSSPSKLGTDRIGTEVNSSSLTRVPHCMPPSPQQGRGCGRCKSQSTASSILKNLITCGAVDTKDSVTVLRHNRIRKSSPTNAGSEICKGDKLGGSAGTCQAPWKNQQHHQKARNSFDGVRDPRDCEFSNLKPVPAAYRPVSSPTCSQCGKSFKPQKLHSHMKSCRGMKTLAKKAPSASGSRNKESPWTSATSSDRETERTSLLCH
uniref:SOSEKI DIX-like domain-containing protein n=1 Tax=Kalanchoe fedtschenkoi TaxID=63787 RepID=A0A7N0T631_KALFE